MHLLRTNLLRHDRFGDSHCDWLMEYPHGVNGGGRGPLLCFRMALPGAWTDGRTRAMLLRRLPDHRRVYLDYQGPISGRRGHVKRLDAGRASVLRFSLDRIDLRVSWRRGGEWRVCLRRVAIDSWSAAFYPV